MEGVKEVRPAEASLTEELGSLTTAGRWGGGYIIRGYGGSLGTRPRCCFEISPADGYPVTPGSAPRPG